MGTDKAPEGYTHITEAADKWGHTRAWWYDVVKNGELTGYRIPGMRGTFLRDEAVVAFLQPRPIERNQEVG